MLTQDGVCAALLLQELEGDATVLQFGRVGQNKFTMDYQVARRQAVGGWTRDKALLPV